MSDANSCFDELFTEEVSNLKNVDFASDEATTMLKNLRVLSECRPPAPAPEPEAAPEPPNTVLGKLMAGAAGVWDNETTRVVIKAGGSFAAVALVVWTTIHRDHVIERNAMSLATQRNS